MIRSLEPATAVHDESIFPSGDLLTYHNPSINLYESWGSDHLSPMELHGSIDTSERTTSWSLAPVQDSQIIYSPVYSPNSQDTSKRSGPAAFDLRVSLGSTRQPKADGNPAPTASVIHDEVPLQLQSSTTRAQGEATIENTWYDGKWTLETAVGNRRHRRGKRQCAHGHRRDHESSPQEHQQSNEFSHDQDKTHHHKVRNHSRSRVSRMNVA